VTYWRDGSEEVDIVVSHGVQAWAVEVKIGRYDKPTGLGAFRRHYPAAKAWPVGDTGISKADFFSRPAQDWFR